jgi:hypothetical protein
MCVAFQPLLVTFRSRLNPEARTYVELEELLPAFER